MTIRSYRPEDLDEILQLFYDTVHAVNARDYAPEQLDAWADGRADREAWNRSLLEHDTRVALIGETIVGFADMDENGYLDRLYVHRDFQGKGIASAFGLASGTPIILWHELNYGIQDTLLCESVVAFNPKFVTLRALHRW